MNKKIIAIVMAVVMVAASAFANGASEATLVYNAANKVADSASTYVAGNHSLTYQSLDASGNVVSESSQQLSVDKKTADGWYFETFTQGSDVLSKVASVYDGFTFTPFDNGISSSMMSYSLEGQETIDGTLCNVIDMEYALDPALLQYKAHFQGSDSLMGYDADDDDLDGSVTATAYVDAQTSALVKLVLNWEIGSQTIVQTNTYAAMGSASVPTQITFDVTSSQFTNGIIKNSSFRVIDELSDYITVNSFTRTRS